jgi:hypothetical protein
MLTPQDIVDGMVLMAFLTASGFMIWGGLKLAKWLTNKLNKLMGL